MKQYWKKAAAGAVALAMTFSSAGYFPLLPVNAVGSSTVVQELAAAPAPTTAEPYTLTIDDVQVVQCKEDDSVSDSPVIDALWIQGIKSDVDFSDAKYKNIVIPETLPFEVPDLDKDGKEQKDEEGKVITKTVELPVIKFGIDFGGTTSDNLEKVTVSKNLREFTHDFAGCKNLTEFVIPEDAALETFYFGGYSKGMFYQTGLKEIYIPAGVKVGKNTAIWGETTAEDYPNGLLDSGDAIVKAGGVK